MRTHKDIKKYLSDNLSKTEGIISIDLDGTLITSDYYYPPKKSTQEFKEIKRVIKKLQSKDYLVCLNSARSLYALKKWQRFFGTDYPNFAEYGLIIDFASASTRFVLAEDEYVLIEILRKKFIHTVGKAVKKSGYKDVEIRFCDDMEPEEFITQSLASSDWPDKNDAYAIYVNGMNKLRLGLRALRKSNLETLFDSRFYKIVLKHLKKTATDLFGETPRLHYQTYPQKSVMVAYVRRPEKTLPLHTMAEYLASNKNCPVYHIGNGKEDIIKDKRVHVLAVANADKIMKKAAEMVSEKSYTNGVTELLNRILI